MLAPATTARRGNRGPEGRATGWRVTTLTLWSNPVSTREGGRGRPVPAVPPVPPWQRAKGRRRCRGAARWDKAVAVGEMSGAGGSGHPRADRDVPVGGAGPPSRRRCPVGTSPVPGRSPPPFPPSLPLPHAKHTRNHLANQLLFPVNPSPLQILRTHPCQRADRRTDGRITPHRAPQIQPRSPSPSPLNPSPTAPRWVAGVRVQRTPPISHSDGF